MRHAGIDHLEQLILILELVELVLVIHLRHKHVLSHVHQLDQ